MIWLFNVRSAYALHTYFSSSFHFHCQNPLYFSIKLFHLWQGIGAQDLDICINTTGI